MNRISYSVFATILSLALTAAAAPFENAYVALTFDGAGTLASVREKASGRELVGRRLPLAEVRLATGEKLLPTALAVDGARLAVDFGARGRLTLSAKPFDGGWTFTTESFTVTNAARLVFFRVRPACDGTMGPMANVVMDANSAVALRGYTPDIDLGNPYDARTRTLFAAIDARFGFTGKSVGFAAGPRRAITDQLKAMTLAAGVPHTACGGAWSCESDENRASYLFAAFMDYGSLDDWIRLLDKAGCTMLHFHLWWTTRGSYDVSPACFPGGLPQLAQAVARVHAAGKLASTHTLSAAIECGDRYVSPEWYDDYVTLANYTLARPYRAGETELYVNEQPWKDHSRTLTGGTHGNVLRLGDDLLQYTDFSREKPYRFTGVHVAREPFGDAEVWDPAQAVTGEFKETAAVKSRRMRRASYPAGSRVDYLHQRYGEFYAKVGSPLADRLADEIADKYNACGFDGLYFDGCEGQPGIYERNWMTQRVFERLKPRNGCIINSRSSNDKYNWWFRSLQGTWDSPSFGPRTFHDRHIASDLRSVEQDLMPVDLGWWRTHESTRGSRGYFPEDMEYYGCKSAANDCTVSVNGARVSDGPIPFSMDVQLTIFGWWARARYARAFRPGLQERMRTPGACWQLRQNDAGEWRVAPYRLASHRFGSPDEAAWSVAAPAAEPAALRVEALYAADWAAARTNTVRVLSADMLPALERNAASGVVFTAEAAADPAHGRTLRLTATNRAQAENAAWTELARAMPGRTLLDANEVSVLWVKGDGSGATLNVQLRREREHGRGLSENLVKLDFTGWRRIELPLRERDAEATSRFTWPYFDGNRAGSVFWPICGSAMDGRSCDRATLWLNGLPKGRTVTVEVGVWESVPMMRGGLAAGSRVSVNGDARTVPFALPGGDYAELRDGVWTHYAESGEPVERRAADRALSLRAGPNELAFAAAALAGGSPRAEVTVFAPGADEPAFAALTDEQMRLLGDEYEFPQMLNPARGLTGPFAVRVQPGRRARLGFEIYGPAVNPTVWGRTIPVTLRDAQDKVVSTDGRTWKAVRIVPGELGYEARVSAPVRTTLGEGTLASPLPVLSAGLTRIPVTAERAEGARVTFWKHDLANGEGK